jgi:hypothetical protein
MRPHLQNIQSKMAWRCGSRSRVPALQAQSPEFKLHYHQKRKIQLKFQLFGENLKNLTLLN